MVFLPVEMLELSLGIATRLVTVSVTRDGMQTPEPKMVLLLGAKTLAIAAFFVLNDGYSTSQRFLASAVDTDWLLIAVDDTEPRRSAARYPSITEDVAFSLDLSDGAAGGNGVPALLTARAMVEGSAAEREVLAVEQQSDGEWRIAGYGRTPVGGGEIDLRVTGVGKVYAMALDEWGRLYQPNIDVAVGDTVRPTIFSGWLYRITEAGQLPSTEPEWWAAEGENASRPLGTARAIAVRYFRPLAHGPIPVEVT